jgi:hypothetical protein
MDKWLFIVHPQKTQKVLNLLHLELSVKLNSRIYFLYLIYGVKHKFCEDCLEELYSPATSFSWSFSLLELY